MPRDTIAELLFEAMNNERIEGRAYGSLDWDSLPASHQDKYRRTAEMISAYLRMNPESVEFEGVA